MAMNSSATGGTSMRHISTPSWSLVVLKNHSGRGSRLAAAQMATSTDQMVQLCILTGLAGALAYMKHTLATATIVRLLAAMHVWTNQSEDLQTNQPRSHTLLKYAVARTGAENSRRERSARLRFRIREWIMDGLPFQALWRRTLITQTFPVKPTRHTATKRAGTMVLQSFESEGRYPPAKWRWADMFMVLELASAKAAASITFPTQLVLTEVNFFLSLCLGSSV